MKSSKIAVLTIFSLALVGQNAFAKYGKEQIARNVERAKALAYERSGMIHKGGKEMMHMDEGMMGSAKEYHMQAKEYHQKADKYLMEARKYSDKAYGMMGQEGAEEYYNKAYDNYGMAYDSIKDAKMYTKKAMKMNKKMMK